MTPTTPSQPMTPDESRAIRRHLHSAEGAHLLCRRKACRRARCCRLDQTCASRLYASQLDEELMALRLAYHLALVDHRLRLPRRPAPPLTPAAGSRSRSGGRPPS